MPSQRININIWDDYHEDGYVPEGEIQETYAYVDGGGFTDDDVRMILLELQQSIGMVRTTASALQLSIEWYDSAVVYPNLVGTEHEHCLYKRWQLQMKHLPHREREDLIEALNGLHLDYKGTPIFVYSES